MREKTFKRLMIKDQHLLLIIKIIHDFSRISRLSDLIMKISIKIFLKLFQNSSELDLYKIYQQIKCDYRFLIQI